MGLYGFKKQFIAHIRSGRKRHTIRAKRKHPDKSGNPFHGYYGLRTKQVEKIITSTVTKVEEIAIWEVCGETPEDNFRVSVDGVGLDKDECQALARADGFKNFADMMKFWNGRLPFNGDLIHFRSPEQENIEGSREIRNLLALVDCKVPLAVIRQWTADQKAIAKFWAGKKFLRDSGHRVRAFYRPPFLDQYVGGRCG